MDHRPGTALGKKGLVNNIMPTLPKVGVGDIPPQTKEAGNSAVAAESQAHPTTSKVSVPQYSAGTRNRKQQYKRYQNCRQTPSIRSSRQEQPSSPSPSLSPAGKTQPPTPQGKPPPPPKGKQPPPQQQQQQQGNNSKQGKRQALFIAPVPEDKGNSLNKECQEYFSGFCLKCGNSSHSQVKCKIYPGECNEYLCPICRGGFHSSCKNKKWGVRETYSTKIVAEVRQMHAEITHMYETIMVSENFSTHQVRKPSEGSEDIYVEQNKPTGKPLKPTLELSTQKSPAISFKPLGKNTAVSYVAEDNTQKVTVSLMEKGEGNGSIVTSATPGKGKPQVKKELGTPMKQIFNTEVKVIEPRKNTEVKYLSKLGKEMHAATGYSAVLGPMADTDLTAIKGSAVSTDMTADTGLLSTSTNELEGRRRESTEFVLYLILFLVTIFLKLFFE